MRNTADHQTHVHPEAGTHRCPGMISDMCTHLALHSQGLVSYVLHTVSGYAWVCKTVSDGKHAG